MDHHDFDQGHLAGSDDAGAMHMDHNIDGYLLDSSAFALGSIDTDGDGVADAFDIDLDGVPDAADTDGDGYIDAYDTDHDGILDSFITAQDANGDGNPDMMHTVLKDTDGDGILDTILQQIDTNGDGAPDAVQAYMEAGGLLGADGATMGEYSGIVGDPEDDIAHWEYQGDTNRCAVFSQMFAIEDLLGIEINPDDLTQVAEDHGWFDDGTPPNCMDKLLEYYGLQTETSNGTIDDIADCLNNGGKVIVGVDSSEIWEGPDHESIYSPGMQADHAVEVIGLDYSDPSHPMVILNDSGTPDGAGETVPLEQFQDAWQDSGNLMVEAYA